MSLAPGLLEAFGLTLARTSAFVLSAPLLGSGSGFDGHRIGLITVLALFLFSVSGAPLDHAPLPVEFAVLVLREVLVGLFLAFVLHATVLAVRVAGELIGHEMTFNMAQLVDPATGLNSPLVTRLYEGLFYLGLLALDGHHWLVRALAGSFEVAPVGVLELERGLLGVVLELFGELFVAGVCFAAPVMVGLALVSLTIGLLARAVPQLNVLEIGFTLRIALGLVALLVFAPLIAPALGVLYLRLQEGLEAALGALAS
jgi:flagellar biosynthetic protein FliR